MTAVRHTFLTETEFAARFGPQVVDAVAMLDKHAGKVCQPCAGECCRRVGCEFYSPGFRSCPIHEYRPAKCRLYFCDRVLENDSLTAEEREMISAPVEDLSAVLRQVWGLSIFLEPPVKVGEKNWLALLGVEDRVKLIVQAFENGDMDRESATAGLLDLVRGCRQAV